MRQKRKLLLFLACLAVLMGIGIGKTSVYAETCGTIILEKGTKGNLYDMITYGYTGSQHTSSNNKIVSVDRYNKVYAKKTGNATISQDDYWGMPVRVKVIDKKIAFKNTTITTAHDPEKLAEKLKLNVGTVQTKCEYGNKLYVFSKVPFTSIQSSNYAVIDAWSIDWNEKKGYSELWFEIKGSGTTTITAKVGNKAMKCKVTIIDPKLNETEVCKIVGNKTTLKVTGVKGKVKWKSENPAVATVDSKGVVTAKDLGTTYIDATVKGVTLRCKFTTEPVPQFVNIYTMKGINKVVLADTVLRTSVANKFDTTINDEGKTETSYNWDEVGDITDVSFKDEKTYPVYDIEKSSYGYNETEIYLAGSSQNAVIKRLDSTINGGSDVYCEYEPGDGMGTIRIYSKDSSPALYQVKIDGHVLVFATRCREENETKPTDKRAQSTETATYVRQNISAFNVDISDAMISVGKYIIDKTIETAVGAIVDKFFPW